VASSALAGARSARGLGARRGLIGSCCSIICAIRSPICCFGEIPYDDSDVAVPVDQMAPYERIIIPRGEPGVPRDRGRFPPATCHERDGAAVSQRAGRPGLVNAVIARPETAPAARCVMMKPGNDEPPVFLIPGATGSVLQLAPLASAMSIRCRSNAIKPRGMEEDETPCRHLCEMASTRSR